MCWNSRGNATWIIDSDISDIWQPKTCEFRFDPGAKFLAGLILESVQKKVRPVRKSGHFSWWDTIFENMVLTVPPITRNLRKIFQTVYRYFHRSGHWRPGEKMWHSGLTWEDILFWSFPAQNRRSFARKRDSCVFRVVGASLEGWIEIPKITSFSVFPKNDKYLYTVWKGFEDYAYYRE